MQSLFLSVDIPDADKSIDVCCCDEGEGIMGGDTDDRGVFQFRFDSNLSP